MKIDSVYTLSSLTLSERVLAAGPLGGHRGGQPYPAKALQGPVAENGRTDDVGRR